jgi:hypothetical protein
MKLVSAAVAAEKLGWDYRYTTKIYATGPLTDGDLDGDLVIVSNGDPTINTRHPDRWGAFDAWAKQLYAKGVRRVGRSADRRRQRVCRTGLGHRLGLGRSRRRRRRGGRRPQYNENQVELLVGPGLEPGARAIISVSPPGSGIILDHGVTTVAAGQPSGFSVERVPGFEHPSRPRANGGRRRRHRRRRGRAQPDDPLPECAPRSARPQRHLRRRQSRSISTMRA